MSEFYAESNDESTIELFNKRTIYRSEILVNSRQQSNNHIRDMNLGELSYYGKMNNYYSPIYTNSDKSSNLKKLNSSDPKQPLSAYNFVADLFNEMCLKFEQCAMENKISKTDNYLSNLKAYKAYSDPVLVYRQYIEIFGEQLRSIFVRRNVQVEDFAHFMDEFMLVAPSIVDKTPFTFSSFIKSKNNNVFSSGLAIEVADLPYDNDEEKRKQFFESKNWDFFVQACNNYGFIIDYNAPWRIICDIKAPQLNPYMAEYGHPNGQFLLDMGFDSAMMRSISIMPEIFLDLYNAVRKPVFLKIEKCSDGSILKKKVNSKVFPTVNDVFNEIRTLAYFPIIYMQLRLHEEQVEMPRAKKRKIINDIMTLVNATASYLPIEELFERKINKPFDKKYTFDYHFNVMEPAKFMKRFERGLIESYAIENRKGGENIPDPRQTLYNTRG